MRTPYFCIDEQKLRQNGEILRAVAKEAGCKILLAQKAYSVYQTYPLLEEYLSGTAASGVYEAKLGREHFRGEVHAFSPAFREEDVRELVKLCDHIVFNTPAQVKKYAPLCREAGVSAGLRVNPECSTQEGHAIYDPCAPGSRLGTTAENFDEGILPLLDGLHFHTLCEQDADALEQTADAFRQKFGKYAGKMRWLNLGGGHHITRRGYDTERLCRVVRGLRQDFGADIYLEPGEAVVLDAGTLHTRVLEVMKNGIDIAILDASAACHMPDVLEMPYRPPLYGSGETSSATTPSTRPFKRATSSSSATWRCIRWSRPTPSTACPCPPSACTARAAACRCCANSAMKTSNRACKRQKDSKYRQAPRTERCRARFAFQIGRLTLLAAVRALLSG